MREQILIFIINGIDSFQDIFKGRQEAFPFNSLFITFEDFLSKKYEEDLKEIECNDLWIAIEQSFYINVKDKLSSYMNTLYNLSFTNYLYLILDSNQVEETNIKNGKKAFYYLSEEKDNIVQSKNFISYISMLFNKSLTTERLSKYISNSIKDIVYTEILKKRNDKFKRLLCELKEETKIDNLTKLYNRKTIFDYLEKERRRTQRGIWRFAHCLKDDTNLKKENEFIVAGQPKGNFLDHFGVYSIMMIDIDDFKLVNDSYGHIAGDKVLKRLGELILNYNILRSNDIAGRFGGEEFVVILPETNSSNAYKPASRLNEEFKKTTFVDDKNNPFNVTL